MGAATNFGKNELDINSPTHKNTHSEQLFSANNNVTNSNNDLLDDLFNSSSDKKSSVDDFNPRAEESQDFGDFSSAFGGTETQTQKTTNEFADFGTAFVSSSNSMNTPSLEDSLFDIPAVANSPYENISNVDLFGHTISQSMSSSNNSDLLSDFGMLNMNTPISKYISNIFIFSNRQNNIFATIDKLL